MTSGTSAVFWRFFHWGPITAISIIKSITFMTLYMNAMWWPPHQSVGGFINQSIFLLLSASTGFNFVMASLVGPKFLPLRWHPKNPSDEQRLQYCYSCEGFKAPRSHHCRKCDRCVIKMDHHCPWINHCVGWANHAYFTCFLAFAVAGCTHATFILSGSLYAGLYRDWYVYYGQYSKATVLLGLWSLIFGVFNVGLAIGVIIAVGMLLFFQVRAILNNRTGIEDWIVEKARHRREGTDESFRYPYDLGKWKNVQQVASWTCSSIGNGVEWAVAEGCDQFTLTQEQILQKTEKRARTRTYTISKPVSGSWMPLWTQGYKVCLSPPLTDEPRIKLFVGDVVRVTRWKKHWLFGEKVNLETHEGKNGGKKVGKTQKEKKVEHMEHSHKPRRIRGWFPRQCAVELVEDGDDAEQHQHFNDRKKNK
ncbi:palmitoyltransferase ZDHHC6-like [Toxorhynchites rutilus septentrionalis]|uniref:palmitoyltransferase ZDHHC6-like n=1 Tax=Toxorhynchites rutilus septentrionalis TaxID=329112 RepID=UPI002478374A|nr:palmitoyltransferase ZDHHC6-like [Toxorhynchites rutilus septentrionalis]XP_055616519.1 palmitoyltransferase ZDHHC6-like [Toxorhynchites rutilus septentrionalis]